MKRVVTIVLIIVVILIAAVLALPLFFKQNLLDYARNTLNKQLNAQVEVADLKLSFFRSFPKVSVELQGVVIQGEGTLENDTLLQLNSLQTTTDFKSVLHPSYMHIEEIVVRNAKINLLVAESGEANWDIQKTNTNSAAQKQEPQEAESEFHMQLDKIEIRDVSVIYDDRAADMLLQLDDIDFDVSGQMFGSSTLLKTNGGVNEFSFCYGGIN